MPTTFQLVETTFPQGDGKSTEQQLRGIYNYLFVLLEQLRYTLFNLDESNFNQDLLNQFISGISSPIYAEIGKAEESITKLSIEAGHLQSQISGKIGSEDAQTLIDQSLDALTLAATSGANGTMFTISKDGAVLVSTGSFDVHVKSVNIDGALTVGQLPDGVAMESDIPTQISQLTNNMNYQTLSDINARGFQDASGVTSIINGTVTTDYVNALGVYASYLLGDSIIIKYKSNGIEYPSGYITTNLTTTGGGLGLQSTAGLRLVAGSGSNVYLASNAGASGGWLGLYPGYVSIGGPMLVLSSGMFGTAAPASAVPSPISGTIYFQRVS